MQGARRYEVGEKCTPTILLGAIAALEQIKEWKVDRIALTISDITQKISSFIEKIGFILPDSSYRCPHMFGPKVPEKYNGNLVLELKKKNIYTQQ